MQASATLSAYVDGDPATRSKMRRSALRMAWSAVREEAWSRRARAVHWQYLCRRERPFALAQGRESYVVRVRDEHIGRAVYTSGDFEFWKFSLAVDLLGRRSVRTVLDVGANIGSVCIPAVARGLASTAVAIEPEPVNVALLRANVALNGLTDRISVVPAAAGRESGISLDLELAESNFGDHRIASPFARRSDRSGSMVVTSLSLDDLGMSLSSEHDLVWMDVQGYEGEVLSGATAIVARTVPVVLEFWPDAMSEHGGHAVVEAVMQGYPAFVDLSVPARGPQPIHRLAGLADELMSLGSQTDLLFLPSGSVAA